MDATEPIRFLVKFTLTPALRLVSATAGTMQAVAQAFLPQAPVTPIPPATKVAPPPKAKEVAQARQPQRTTTIRGNCPSCGDVQLDAAAIIVRVCADDEKGSYNFRCPDCQGCVATEANRRIVDLLVSSGAKMQVWRLPAELRETKIGEPLTPDDLLDMHLLLANDDWFETLAAEVRRSLNR